MADKSSHTPSQDEPSSHTESPLPRAVPVERVERLLAHGEITLHDTMLWGSNYAALVTVSNQELQTIAVYKPQRGERPLWDFPRGTLCRRETAAYIVSQALGWGLVPPTVLRQGPHGLGSLQLFIEHDPEISYFSLDRSFDPQLQRFVVFDTLTNNADRKGGHLLLDARGKLWGIDHGLTFNTAPKLRTVIWEYAGQPVADNLLAPVRDLCEQLTDEDQPTYRKLAGLLNSAEIEALQRRINRLLERPHYPEPGPGPNHPWPPV
jgi:hypothetical protein